MLTALVTLLSFLQNEDWPQFKFDARHSGNAADREVKPPLGLLAAVPLSDAIFTSPVVADGTIYVVDGSGWAYAIDEKTFQILWKCAVPGPLSFNNVSSPAVTGDYLHFAMTNGVYCVIERKTGKIVESHFFADPIFSSLVVGNGRVYGATLGAKVFAVEPQGKLLWEWDFVKEVVKFEGDRWSGEDWLKFKKGRVTWKEHFCCSRDISLSGKMVIVPAGGRTLFLEDAGDRAELRATGVIPDNGSGNEYPATFGQSVGEEGEVYVQWPRRDNAGRVEILRLRDGKIQDDFVRGTETAIHLAGLMSFSSPSMRGKDFYRTRSSEER